MASPSPSSTTAPAPATGAGVAPDEPPSARQLKAQATRRRLFDAAQELFARQGYHQTTVEQIVRRAGVAKGTFFLHFATKEAVVAQLVEGQTRAAKRARLQALAGGGPLAALRATILTLGEKAEFSRELSRAVVTATLSSDQVGGAAHALFGELLASLELDARAAQRAGLLPRRPGPAAIADALLASYMGALLHFTASGRARPLGPLLATLVDVNLQASKVPHEARAHAKPARLRARTQRPRPARRGRPRV